MAQRTAGLFLIALAVTAAVAPPFSGLDTLPGMGAVIICLGLILGDVVVVAIGAVLGVSGALLIATIGAAVVHWSRQYLF